MVAVVAVIALGVLAASLVKLAGGSSSAAKTLATAAAPVSVTSPGTATLLPTRSATTPAAKPPPAAPPVALAPLKTLTPSTAGLNGTVNPEGVPTTYQFEYGLTTSYGQFVPSRPTAAGAGRAAFGVAYKIEFLKPGTTYHYRLTTSKAGRVVSTADATFTTPR